jgi:hypothetical protein
VGESPPPHKGFFYDVTTTAGPLSRSTTKSFEDFFGREYSDREEFLDHFKSLGCYLIDLFKERGKTVHDAGIHEKEIAVRELNAFIQEVKPRFVLSVLKRTGKLVQEAVNRTDLVRFKVLPYPTRNYVRHYSDGLIDVLSACYLT